jgi:hypothetical protein
MDSLFCESEKRGLPFIIRLLQSYTAQQYDLQRQNFDECGRVLQEYGEVILKKYAVSDLNQL